jgi:hypothetical protein
MATLFDKYDITLRKIYCKDRAIDIEFHKNEPKSKTVLSVSTVLKID